MSTPGSGYTNLARFGPKGHMSCEYRLSDCFSTYCDACGPRHPRSWQQHTVISRVSTVHQKNLWPHIWHSDRLERQNNYVVDPGLRRRLAFQFLCSESQHIQLEGGQACIHEASRNSNRSMWEAPVLSISARLYIGFALQYKDGLYNLSHLYNILVITG